MQLLEISSQKTLKAQSTPGEISEYVNAKTFEVDLQALRCFLYLCFYAVMCTGIGSL